VAIRMLLSRAGVEPNSKRMFGLTPLIVAAENGHVAVV
jgi:ankyrin repeat protein